MANKVTIYHNSRCSKSRATFAILQDLQVNIEEIVYLETPPTADELTNILKMLDKNAIEIIRTGEKRFKELGLNKSDNKSNQQWIDIMVNNPILIERPIVVAKGKAVIGRPPENVLTIL